MSSSHQVTQRGVNMSETEKIKLLIDEQISQLRHKRDEVLSRVKSELDDIDKALRHLGYDPSQTTGSSKRRRRARVEDSQLKEIFRSFMKSGESFSAAQILEKADIKAPRFASFKAANRDFLKAHGAKRSMRYSLAEQSH